MVERVFDPELNTVVSIFEPRSQSGLRIEWDESARRVIRRWSAIDHLNLYPKQTTIAAWPKSMKFTGAVATRNAVWILVDREVLSGNDKFKLDHGSSLADGEPKLCRGDGDRDTCGGGNSTLCGGSGWPDPDCLQLPDGTEQIYNGYPTTDNGLVMDLYFWTHDLSVFANDSWTGYDYDFPWNTNTLKIVRPDSIIESCPQPASACAKSGGEVRLVFPGGFFDDRLFVLAHEYGHFIHYKYGHVGDSSKASRGLKEGFAQQNTLRYAAYRAKFASSRSHDPDITPSRYCDQHWEAAQGDHRVRYPHTRTNEGCSTLNPCEVGELCENQICTRSCMTALDCDPGEECKQTSPTTRRCLDPCGTDSFAYSQGEAIPTAQDNQIFNSSFFRFTPWQEGSPCGAPNSCDADNDCVSGQCCLPGDEDCETGKCIFHPYLCGSVVGAAYWTLLHNELRVGFGSRTTNPIQYRSAGLPITYHPQHEALVNNAFTYAIQSLPSNASIGDFFNRVSEKFYTWQNIGNITAEDRHRVNLALTVHCLGWSSGICDPSNANYNNYHRTLGAFYPASWIQRASWDGTSIFPPNNKEYFLRAENMQRSGSWVLLSFNTSADGYGYMRLDSPDDQLCMNINYPNLSGTTFELRASVKSPLGRNVTLQARIDPAPFTNWNVTASLNNWVWSTGPEFTGVSPGFHQTCIKSNSSSPVDIDAIVIHREF